MSRTEIAPGKNFYGVDVGIVLVPTRFPRPPGDIGNARSFDFPVAYEIAPAMTTEQMLAKRTEGMVDAASVAAGALVDRGIRAVATSCGLMAKYQRELTEAVDVPIAGSSLVQIPLILQILPQGSSLGILTFDRDSLLEGGHFEGLGLSQEQTARIEVEGLDRDGYLASALLGGGALDLDRAEQDILALAQRLRSRVPRLGALLLECTNMSPYSRALREALDVPVWDAIALVDWLQSGIERTP